MRKYYLLAPLFPLVILTSCSNGSLSSTQALDALEKDHDYLTAGGVFPEELISNFIKTKRAECREIANIPHPAEFDRYFNL